MRQQRGQYLLAVSLSRYKWYHSQTPDDVPVRRLSPEGGGHEGCASKEAGLRRGVDTRWCANNDAGSRKGVDCEMPHRLKRRTKHSL